MSRRGFTAATLVIALMGLSSLALLYAVLGRMQASVASRPAHQTAPRLGPAAASPDGQLAALGFKPTRAHPLPLEPVQALVPVDGRAYPNELAGLRFHARGPWNRLVPLVSTMDEARRALGPVLPALDPARTGSEPGAPDAAAAGLGREPRALVYEAPPGWRLQIRSVEAASQERLPAELASRIFSIDFVPMEKVDLPADALSAAFKHRSTASSGGTLDEYADGSGLVYVVRAAGSPTRGGESRTLVAIRYGPSEEALGALRPSAP